MNELFGRCWISPLIVNILIPLNASFSIDIIDDGKLISVNDVHSSNADTPIVVKEFVFNFISDKDEQFLNVSLGIFWISPLIVNFETPWNELFSNFWTEDGSVISVREEHPSNTYDPNDVNFGVLNTIFSNFEEYLKELLGICWISPVIDNCVIPWNAVQLIDIIDDGRVTFANEKQFSNIESWIEVIDEGIIILFIDLHFINAEYWISLIVGGIVISVKEEHSLNANDWNDVNVLVLKIILVNVSQFLNVPSGINCKSPEIVNFWIPLNALFSIVWTDEGIVISDNDVHPSNADDPIELIVFVLSITLVNE